MRTPALFVLALVPAGLVSGDTNPELQVIAVRSWTVGDVTRVAVEVNGDFTFKRDRLNNPDRLFFDILDARPNVGGLRFATHPVSDKLLRQIRIAETLPGRTRIVLDLNTSVDYTVSKLVNPDRLMIELRPSGPGAPKQPDAISAPADVSVLSSTVGQIPSALAKPARPEGLPLIPVPPPSIPAVADSHPASSITASLPPVRPVDSATPARKSTSDGTRSLIRALGLKINRVVIDAGHGGHDVGTTGVTGLLEKDLVLDVALRLGKLIEQRMGSEVIFTRQDDSFVPLEERTAIANRNHADLFLSIHANSSPLKSVAGVETFYLNFTSSSDALDVAARENASSQKSVFELRDLIQSISLHDKIEESKEFATDVQRTMQANAVRYISSARDRGIKKAPFVVLIGAQMPSVLSEIGFLSNPREESLLKRPEHRQQIAEALYKGFSRYSDSLSHIQVAGKAPGIAAKPDRELAAK